MATAKKIETKKLTLQRFDGEQWVDKKKVSISEDSARIFNENANVRKLRYKEVLETKEK